MCPLSPADRHDLPRLIDKLVPGEAAVVELFREHLETADAEARGQQEPSYIGGSESDS